MDYTAYMKYLQAILKKCGAIAAPIKDLLIWYVRDGLKFSIYT